MVVFFPTAPRHATSVFLTFRVSHCIKLPGSPDGSPPQLFDGIYDMQMLLVMEFSIAMSKVPIKNRDFDSIQDEIWRDLGFSLL